MTTTTTTMEHIAKCSSLSESTYHGKHNKLAKIIHQQTAIQNELLDRNILSYYRHTPELVLESANKILYWNRSIITDKTVAFNRPHTTLIERQSKTALVTDVAVLLSHNLAKTEAEKITKYENLALEIKNIWKINNESIYPLVISAEEMVTRNFLKYLENMGLTKNILRVEQKAVQLQTCHIVCKFLGHTP